MRKLSTLFLTLMLVAAFVFSASAAETQNADQAVAQVVETGVYYTDLSDALQAATDGQTVRMLQDTQEVIVSVKEHTTLDLGGYTLTATYASVFGYVEDNSAENTGVLKVDEKKLLINTDNSQLPVMTEAGYQFVEVVGFNTAWMNENTFVFQPLFEKVGNELLKGGVANTGVSIQVEVSWKPFADSEDLDSRTFKYGDTLTGQYFGSYNAETGKYGRMFTLSLVNPGNYVDLSCHCKVVSNTRVEFAPEKSEYLTEEVYLTTEQASAIVPAGTKLTDSDVSLGLTTTEMEKTTSDVVLTDGETMLSMDVHVKGVAADNTVPVIVTLNEVTLKGLNEGNIKLYHVENGVTNEMTRVYTIEEVDEHNEYFYDIPTGTITVALKSFSEVAVVADEKNYWDGVTKDTSWYDDKKNSFNIYNADQLAGFGAIVDGTAVDAYGNAIAQDSFKGKTVTLCLDVHLSDGKHTDGTKSFNPIGFGYEFVEYTYTECTGKGKVFKGTFDGNGNTIHGLYQNCWQMGADTYTYSAVGAGLFASVVDATIKNLTMDNAYIVLECVDMGTVVGYANGDCHFENIVIKNSVLGNHNRCAGGAIGEIGGGGTYTLKNVDVEASTTISGLWGSFGVSAGGLIGGKWGEAGNRYGIGTNVTVTMENCDVACTLDVYNDVTSAYQWYAYRFCGMLIGHTEEWETEESGRTVATASWLTTKNCTVQYGDWVNYTYCRFSETTSLGGRYPWVRVERGRFTDPYSNIRYGVPQFAKDTLNAETHIGDKNCHAETDEHCLPIIVNQLYGGDQGVYGGNWHAEDPSRGVTVLSKDGIKLEPTTKFSDTGVTTIVSGTKVKLGDLFTGTETVIGNNVYAFVSPANKDSKVEVTSVAPVITGEWEDYELTITGTGLAKITINDYYYCQPTVIEVTVGAACAKIGDTEYASVQDALNAAKDGDTVTLLDHVAVSEYVDVYTANNGETERNITLDLAGYTISWAEDYKYQWYPLVFVGINQTLNITNGSIIANEHVAVGAYGTVNLDNVDVTNGNDSDEQAVCIWNWNKNDEYYEDCELYVTGSATISGGSITGGILVEGPVTLRADAGFDKLYLNNSTGHGKVMLPAGYGLVKQTGYYDTLHLHTFDANNKCTVCGLEIKFELTALENIQSSDSVVITLTDGTTTWALTSADATGKVPAAVEVEVDVEGNYITENVSTDLYWNINNIADVLTIYANGQSTNYLYCLAKSDGVRAGAHGDSYEKNEFIIKDGQLYNVFAERYLVVNTEKFNWRAYEKSTGQTLKFYVLRSTCEHANKEERAAIAATCTQAGHEAGTYCLDCNTYVDGGKLINAVGHVFGDPVVTEATCTTDGKKIYRCTVCNSIKKETIKAAHTWDEGTVTTEPGCETTGVKTFICTVDGCTGTKTEKIEALGHTEVIDEAVAPTCTETGLTEGKHCSVCGTVTVAQNEVAALGHTEVIDEAVAPTCTATGLTEGKHCSVCGAITVAQNEVAALPHTEVTDAAVAATCTTTGLTEGKHCPVCNKVIVAQTIVEAKGHTEVIDKVVEATCTTTGLTEGKHCSVCNEVLVAQTTVAAKGHNYNSVVTAPTATEQGYTTHTCSGCGDSYTDSYVEAKGYVVYFHAYNNLTAETGTDFKLTAPTTCPTGYKFEGWTETKLADESIISPVLLQVTTYVPTEDVTNLYAVYSRTETTEGTPGTTTYDLVTDATTLKAGDKLVLVSGNYVAGNINDSVMASISGVAIVKDKISTLPNGAVVLTLGGSSGNWTFTNSSGKLLGATAVKKVAWGSGTTTWSISISSNNATIQNTNSKYGRFLYNVQSPRFTTYTSNTSTSMLLPQLYRETTTAGTSGTTTTYYITYEVSCLHSKTTTTTVPATCTTAGSATVICDDCGDIVSNETIAALGHKWNNGEVTTAATCGEAGIMTYTCSECLETKTEEISATGNHNFVDGTCSVCGLSQSTSETIDFSTTAQRVSFSTASQVWENGGLTVTNNKGSSTANVADYYNPVRFYKSSNVVINYAGMTKIEVACGSTSYADALKESVVGATVTVEGSTVIIALSNAADTFTITGLAAQVQVKTITVYADAQTGDDSGENDVETTSKIYTFANYTAGTQYAQNEKHVLDDVVTVTTTKCHFTSELRIYSSDSYNGYAVITSATAISSITVNAGNSADKLQVYGRNGDSEEWELIGEISVSSSYADLTLDFDGETYTQIKLDVAGTKQIRIKAMTLVFIKP